MQLSRVAVTSTATLVHTFYVDEDPTASTTDVTVSIVDANGAAVTSGTADTAETGVYTFTLPSQAQLAVLSVAWSATILGASVVETDLVEIVGGFFFTLAEARGSDTSLADATKYPTAVLARARLETEIECESICGRAFVPRYGRVVLDGSGTSELMLPDADVRTIRAARVAPTLGQDFVALTDTQLSTVDVTDDRILRRVDQDIWTEGRSNVVVEYEFGLTTPPLPLVEQTFVRLRSLVTKHNSRIPDRASSFTTVDGGTYRLSMPSRFSTGIPEVDAVYQRYALGAGATGAGGSGALPASRQLNFDPQWWSMYHGGTR